MCTSCQHNADRGTQTSHSRSRAVAPQKDPRQPGFSSVQYHRERNTSGDSRAQRFRQHSGWVKGGDMRGMWSNSLALYEEPEAGASIDTCSTNHLGRHRESGEPSQLNWWSGRVLTPCRRRGRPVPSPMVIPYTCTASCEKGLPGVRRRRGMVCIA
jgi:hypothetical protein